MSGRLIFILLIFAVFSVGVNAQSKTVKPLKNKQLETDKKSADKEKYNTVYEGRGISGVVVGVSTMDDVVKKFGKKYKWVENKKYSYQMNYGSLGLAFYMCQGDKRKEIFLIEIKPPYKAKTSKGVILGKTTKEETEKVYGKPRDGFEYRGVSFYYNNRRNQNIISEIDVTENKGIRQCQERK